MIPITQTILHSDTQKGNCLRAALASLLEIDIDSMPKFEEMGEDWFLDLRKWMRSHNGKTVNVCHAAIKPCGYSLAAGMSPRNIYHCVVALNGEVVFDPHPSRDGLIEVERYWVIEAENE